MQQALPVVIVGRERRAALIGLAMLPAFAMGLISAGRGEANLDIVAAFFGGLRQVGPLVAVAVLAAVATNVLSARIMKRNTCVGAAATAGFLFALTLPPSTAIVPATTSIVFGVLVGREIFPSVEQSFVHPAVLGYVFLTLSWPQALGSGSMWGAADGTWSDLIVMGPGVGAIGAQSALACGVGAVFLLVVGLIPWRILAAVPLGVALGVTLFEQGPDRIPVFAHFVLGTLTFGTVFLATDATSAPRTSSAQWFHGFLLGMLVMLFRLTKPASPDGTLSALLIISVFAPLADHVVRASRARFEARHE